MKKLRGPIPRFFFSYQQIVERRSTIDGARSRLLPFPAF